MNRDNQNIDELLVKYLLGDADAQEHLLLNNWRNASQENERYFLHFELIWQQSKQLETNLNIDENEAWKRLQARLANNQTIQSKRSKKTNLNWQSFVKIAAVLVLFLGIGWFIKQQQNKSQLLVNSGQEVKIDTLSDGSIVTLNKNSSLSYPKNFSGKTREVILKGEAFFNISPNKEMPFIIEANGVQVKVVGTSFNIKTSANQTEVIVETGIVEVSKNKNAVRLLPKEKALVDAEKDAPVKLNNKDKLYSYYRTNEFECINLPLWRVVEALNEAYDSQIIIDNPAIKDLKFRTNLINQSLDENLLIIAETLDIEIEKDGAKILLK